MADGGDGTLDAFHAFLPRSRVLQVRVSGPFGIKVAARLLRMAAGAWLIESADAAGLRLSSRRDPLRASTRGVGELILAALDRGARSIDIGLGGSATNDGGAGLVQALGAQLLDRRGRPIGPGGAGLGRLARIDAASLDARLAETKIRVLTDVDNRLLGPRGATFTFGPQKGAGRRDVKRLEAFMAGYAGIVRRDLGIDLNRIEGGGAAGGMGAALIGIVGGRRISGWREAFRRSRFGFHLRRASAVITGEGAVDQTTLMGKICGHVIHASRRAGVPVYLVCGVCRLHPREIGVTGVVELAELAGSVREAIRRPAHWLDAAARRLAQLLR